MSSVFDYDHLPEKFFVEWSDGNGILDPLKLYFYVNDHSLSRLWKKSLIENYIGENNASNDWPLDKLFLNKGFVTDWETNYSRDIANTCKELNFAIQIVNEKMVPEGYDYIDLNFTVEKLKDPETYRDIMNRVHHHFEILMGQTWNPSVWYTHHTDFLSKWAIHQLNTCCHEIEAAVEYITGDGLRYTSLAFNGDVWEGQEIGTRNRYDLTDEHYAEWKPYILQWGMICPFYCQLGKTPREAWHDGDDYIEDENITAVRYMQGEMNINFIPFSPGVDRHLDLDVREIAFRDWLVKNGRDPDDPTLALGTACIGQVDLSLYTETWQELDAKVSLLDNVTEFGFADENLNTIVSKRYDYTWQEQYMAQIRKHGLEEKYNEYLAGLE
tara:strand:+ start:2454 stop:3605 length:1152 start_codon:yes stop_codon:yes gene_type:complete